MDLRNYQRRKQLTQCEHKKLLRYRQQVQKQAQGKLKQIDQELNKPVTE